MYFNFPRWIFIFDPFVFLRIQRRFFIIARGGKGEMAVPIDTSGSMNTEWADMCVVFYGGNFASGGYFPGLKPLLVSANMTVYETLYALSGNWPAAATSGACSDAYQTGGSGSQGPRNLPL